MDITTDLLKGNGSKEGRDNINYPVVLGVFLILIGIAAILLGTGIFRLAELRSILAAGIGASLIATGITAILTYYITAKHTARQLEDLIKGIVGAPARLLPEKRLIARQYYELTERAENIDIISLSLDAFVANYPLEQVINWVIDDGKEFRILVLSPDCESAKTRGEEEKTNLGHKIDSALNVLSGMCAKANEAISAGSKCKGSFEVRKYDGIPYLAYFKADHEMIIGIYYAHLPGTQSESIYIRREDSIVFEKMEEHFHCLWTGANRLESRPIPVCKIVDGEGGQRPDMPQHITDLPPGLAAFASLLDAQPAPARDAFNYCLALMMVEAGKARLVETVPGESGEVCTFKTVTGDTFSLARPPMSEEQEAGVIATLRDILEDEGEL